MPRVAKVGETSGLLSKTYAVLKRKYSVYINNERRNAFISYITTKSPNHSERLGFNKNIKYFSLRIFNFNKIKI